MAWGARCFISDAPGSSAYMNPLGASFKSPCPIWAFCGGKEVFHDEITEFVKQMKVVAGNDISLRVERLANHDIFYLGNYMGWVSEAKNAADDAGRWLKQLDNA